MKAVYPLKRRELAWIAACGLALPAMPSGAQSQAEELETVLVSGEQPGPGLWKISKDGHVMWVLATFSPLPKNMTWRSKEVERRVAESQLVLYPGRAKVGLDVSMMRQLTLAPSMFKAAKNPDDKTLKDLLPPETYEKWRVLKEKYLGKDDGIERWRPNFAVDRLRGAAMEKSGLGRGPDVQGVVNKAANKNDVPIRTLPMVERKSHVEDPKGILKEARDVEYVDVGCFNASLDRLEPDIESQKLRANAWATGDIEEMRQLGQAVAARVGGVNCTMEAARAMSSGEAPGPKGLDEVMDDMQREAKLAQEEVTRNWLDAAQESLSKNTSTFAVLPMGLFLGPNGYLTKMQALGYEVEEP